MIICLTAWLREDTSHSFFELAFPNRASCKGRWEPGYRTNISAYAVCNHAIGALHGRGILLAGNYTLTHLCVPKKKNGPAGHSVPSHGLMLLFGATRRYAKVGSEPADPVMRRFTPEAIQCRQFLARPRVVLHPFC